MTNPSALYLPGTSGNYVSTPDDASLGITGDICLVAHTALDDWTPTGEHAFISQYFSAGTIAYSFYAVAGGTLRLRWTEDGTIVKEENSSAAPTVSDGQDLWVAVTLDVDNGASDADVKFWTSSDGSSWSQLGATQTVGATTSIFDSSRAVTLGTRLEGTASNLTGSLYYAAIYDGIGANTAPGQGTLVAEFRADAPIEPRYRDSTGKVWTLNGSAYSFVEVS